MGVARSIDITTEQRNTLLALLERHLPDTEAWIYGSRIKWTSRPQSDLDMVVFATPGQARGVSSLREAFEDSNIPFRVDLFVWSDVPDSFRNEIEREHVVLTEPQVCVENWRRMSFAEAVTVNPAVRLERGMKYPFVDMAAVNSGIRCVHAVEQRIYSGSGSRFREGDTLMARITPCLENGKIARYCANHPSANAHGSTEFIVIRGRSGVTVSEYAYYLTHWEEVRSYAVDQMTGTSGRQRVPVESLDSLSVTIPPLPEQCTIAHILGTLDDRIELNRRMNGTLEAMARAIFKDWFVDFGPTRAKVEGREPYLAPELWDLFPDALDDEGKPVGWQTYALSELVQHYRTTVSPSAQPERIFEHYSIPAYDAGGEPACDLGSLIKSNKTMVPKGAVLLSKLNPEIERVWVPNPGGEEPKIASTEFLAFTPLEPATRNVLYCLFKCSGFRAEMVARVTGTSRSHQRVPPASLLACEVLVANPKLLMLFDEMVSPMMDLLLSQRRECLELARTRDLLLPRLISGEIRLAHGDTTAKAVE